ncbi:MAG: hypothetical protein ACRDTH_29220 [Pseudonocardiaceae bacterium]
MPYSRARSTGVTSTNARCSASANTAVVSGAVNPDHFLVDATGAVLERRLGDKRVAVRSLHGGGTEQIARPAGTPISHCVTLAQGLTRPVTPKKFNN